MNNKVKQINQWLGLPSYSKGKRDEINMHLDDKTQGDIAKYYRKGVLSIEVRIHNDTTLNEYQTANSIKYKLRRLFGTSKSQFHIEWLRAYKENKDIEIYDINYLCLLPSLPSAETVIQAYELIKSSIVEDSDVAYEAKRASRKRDYYSNKRKGTVEAS